MFNFIELANMEIAVTEYIFFLEKTIYNGDIEEYEKYLMRKNEYLKLREKLNKAKFEVLEQSKQCIK